MKLYTEEQVKEAVRLSLDDAEKSVVWSKEWYPSKLADRILKDLTPIELPSDEEIENESEYIFYNDKKFWPTIYEIMALRIGAKWMRDKIQGGNK